LETIAATHFPGDVTTTVIVPTHDHGPTLRYSVGSALAQDDPDLEVVIVGDGVSDATKGLVRDLEASDARVRFVDFPKGARHGEGYRNDVINAHSTGDVICYLSDDDLWFPHHVSSMRSLLETADFAHSLPVLVDPLGQGALLYCDFSHDWYRSLFEIANRIPLSCAAHTREAFTRLPVGWHVPEDGIPGDHAIWRQFTRDRRLRLASSMTVSVVVFPSPQRPGWSAERRAAELSEWTDRLRTPSGRDEVLNALVSSGARDATEIEARLSEDAQSLREDIATISAQRREYERLLLETWSTAWWQLHIRIARHRVTAAAARSGARVVRAVRRRFRRRRDRNAPPANGSAGEAPTR
jgi:glycosyltransferase involved in cell wall biosynthesis